MFALTKWSKKKINSDSGCGSKYVASIAHPKYKVVPKEMNRQQVPCTVGSLHFFCITNEKAKLSALGQKFFLMLFPF